MRLIWMALLLATATASADDTYPTPTDPGHVRIDASLRGVEVVSATEEAPALVHDIDLGFNDTCPITDQPFCTQRYADRRLIWWREAGEPWTYATLATGKGDNPHLKILGAAPFGPPGSGSVVGYGTETEPNRGLRGVSYTRQWTIRPWYDPRPDTYKAGTEHSCASTVDYNFAHYPHGPDRRLLWFERPLDGSGGIHRASDCVGHGARLSLLPETDCGDTAVALFLSAPFDRPGGPVGAWRVTGRNCAGELGYWETEGSAYASAVQWRGDDDPEPPPGCEGCEAELAATRLELEEVRRELAATRLELEDCEVHLDGAVDVVVCLSQVAESAEACHE